MKFMIKIIVFIVHEYYINIHISIHTKVNMYFINTCRYMSIEKGMYVLHCTQKPLLFHQRHTIAQYSKLKANIKLIQNSKEGCF